VVAGSIYPIGLLAMLVELAAYTWLTAALGTWISLRSEHTMPALARTLGSLMALNGGPHYTFTPAISLFVSCDTQSDIDRLWERFIADGGVPNRCGWLNDKFGLSWQIIPADLGSLLSGGGDAARAGRVWNAMMQMTKLDIAQLRQASSGHQDSVTPPSLQGAER
jgi:hypothetical protein